MLDKLRVRHFRLIIALLLVFIFGSVTWFIFTTYQEATWAEVSRIGTQKQALARAGAKSISEFFETRKIELLLLAKDPVIQQANAKESRAKIELLYERIVAKGVAGIVRINKKGEFIYGVSEEGWHEKINGNVSQRDYFIWAQNPQNRDQVYISGPYLSQGGPTQGQMLAVMITPVYWQEKFNGIIMLSFLPSELTEAYLLPLQTYPGRHVFIMDQNGTLIACNRVPEMIGKNILEYLTSLNDPKYESFIFLLSEMVAGKESWVVADFVFPGKDYGKEIIGFAPIEVDGIKLSLASTVTYKEALSRLQRFSLQQNLALIFAAAGVVLGGFVFILGIRIAQREAFLDGFRNGRDGVKRARKKS